MSNKDFLQQAEDYERIAKAIGFLEANFKNRPTLDEIAASVFLSKYHFQRLFKRWAGISPNQFLQFLTLDYAKKRLAESKNLLDVSYDSGLSGPGRLHDLFVTIDAITPGEFKKMGAGLKIDYGFHPTPFGECLIASTDRGICHLGFVEADNRLNAVQQLNKNWPRALFNENQTGTRLFVNNIFAAKRNDGARPFHLILKGTNFQVKVWQALLSIPIGCVVSYQDIAAYMGNPKSFRAVASAIAINPIGYLIPCHRVISKSGKIHNYRWGEERKKAIFGWESARPETKRSDQSLQ
jgi:AraC family transcriptional regulator of adaptative response/methylated-DNA-[protein]-cysteine methyltransferase